MAVYINQNLYPGEFLLHKKYAATEMLLELIWTHSNIVVDIALYLLDNYTFDKSELQREYVIQAALLHDVGAYLCEGFEWIPNQPPSKYPYIQHGVLGAWILEREGYSPKVIQVAHCHIGVGFTVEDIRSHAINLPEQDFLPQTPLQKFIMYCSKFHSKAPQFRTPEQIKKSLSAFNPEKAAIFEELEKTYGLPDLQQLETKYDEWNKSYTYRSQQFNKSGATMLTPSGV